MPHRVIQVVLSAVGLLGVLASLAGCQSTAPLPVGPCGNGELNRGEECDNGTLNSDIMPGACRTDCKKAHCGDQVIDTGEECDGVSMPLRTCQDLGFDGGFLLCDYAACVLLTRHCTLCGDNLQDGAEACDGGDLGGMDCGSLGFDEGTLACHVDCTFDLSGCVGGCGNGLREGEEECDGADLAGITCEDLDFEGGQLACGSDCRMDRRGCVGGCGNGVVEPGEICDDGNDIPGDGCTDCRAGDGTFTVGVPLSTGSFPTALRLADVDGDGALDLVVGYAGSAPEWGGVAVHRNLGSRQFAPPQKTLLGLRVSALDVTDFDADDRLDLAITFLGDPDAEEEDPGGLVVLHGVDGGGFNEVARLTPGSRPMGVVAGPLGGSSLPPGLAVLNLGASTVVAYGGDGEGGFTVASTLYAFGWPGHLIMEDMNGDGLPDLLLSRALSATVAIFPNQGLGFGSAVSRYVGDRPAGLAVGRVDGNDSLDIVVALSGIGSVATLPGDGEGGFGYPVRSAVGGTPSLLVGGRFNEDPYFDVVVSDGSSDTVTFLAGVGNGQFMPGDPIVVGDSPSALRAVDLDGDGIIDLVVTCAFSHDVWILWGNELIPGL